MCTGTSSVKVPQRCRYIINTGAVEVQVCHECRCVTGTGASCVQVPHKCRYIINTGAIKVQVCHECRCVINVGTSLVQVHILCRCAMSASLLVDGVFKLSSFRFLKQEGKLKSILGHILWVSFVFVSHPSGLPSCVYVVSRHWRPGQPDNWSDHGLGAGNEDCAHLHVNGRLNDLHCSSNLQFICQKHSVRAWTAAPPTMPPTAIIIRNKTSLMSWCQ